MMLNTIWLILMILSVIFGLINGTITNVVESVTESAKLAFEIALGLTGIIVFWLGLMKIAEDAGLIKLFAKWIQPIMRRLFPDVPANHPAVTYMTMNLAANFLGLGNAATPFGLKAIEELNKLNKLPGTATNAMCTFLAINTSSIQIVPTTAIAFLAAAGSIRPTSIIATSLFATSCSTIAAIAAAKFFEKLRVFRAR